MARSHTGRRRLGTAYSHHCCWSRRLHRRRHFRHFRRCLPVATVRHYRLLGPRHRRPPLSQRRRRRLQCSRPYHPPASPYHQCPLPRCHLPPRTHLRHLRPTRKCPRPRCQQPYRRCPARAAPPPHWSTRGLRKRALRSPPPSHHLGSEKRRTVHDASFGRSSCQTVTSAGDSRRRNDVVPRPKDSSCWEFDGFARRLPLLLALVRT